MRIINDATETVRTCSRCGHEKPESEFYLTVNRGRPYRMRKCKACHAEVAVAWRRRNPDKAAHIEARHAEKKRLTRIEREYGVTPDTLAAMHVSQAGRCAICGSAGSLDVDHDHATGAVRGLLCRNCNRAIGWMHDKPGLLMKAALYLTTSEEASWPRRASSTSPSAASSMPTGTRDSMI